MRKVVRVLLWFALVLVSFLIGAIAHNWLSGWLSATISTLVFVVGGVYLLALEKILNFIGEVHQTVENSSRITFGKGEK